MSSFYRGNKKFSIDRSIDQRGINKCVAFISNTELEDNEHKRIAATMTLSSYTIGICSIYKKSIAIAHRSFTVVDEISKCLSRRRREFFSVGVKKLISFSCTKKRRKSCIADLKSVIVIVRVKSILTANNKAKTFGQIRDKAR